MSSLQFLPVDFSKEMVIGHGALSALCGHAAQPVGWVLGQELSQSKHGSISRKKNNTSCVRNVKMWGMSNNKYFVALAIRPEPGFNHRIICFGEKSNWTLANRHPVKSHP